MLSWVFISCEDQVTEVPSHLMSEQEFAETYAEVQLLEASIKQKLLRGRDSEQEIREYYKEIFEEKGRSQALFEETKSWYAKHPELMQQMVEKAMEVISTMQAGTDELDSSE